MRYKLIFSINNNKLLSDNRRVFLSFFKKALEEYGEKDRYYSLKSKKEYTFSTYFPEAKFSKNEITLGKNEFYLNFSTSSMEEALYMMNSFMGMLKKEFKLPNGNSMTLEKLEMVREKEVKDNSAEFRILSPIIVKERLENKNGDWYFTFKDERWEEILKANMKQQLKDSFDFDPSYDIDELKILGKEPFTKTTQVVNYNIAFPCTLGTIYIEGKKYLLDYFSKSGIGSKRAQGFGMLEVI